MQHETAIRLGVFLGLFVLLALLEALLPRRESKRAGRWPVNWSLVVIDSITLRLVAMAVPLLAVEQLLMLPPGKLVF